MTGPEKNNYVINYVNKYVNFLRRFIRLGRPLTAVFDCSNGTAGPVLKKLTADSRQLTAYFINEKPDGNFPAHGPNPWASGAMRQLQREVVRRKADLGVIFDADGDRVFFIDDRGRVVDPDAVSSLLIWRFRPAKFIVDARSGWLVKKHQVGSIGSRAIESRVGHYFIKKLMRREKSELGVERSGHYYFKKFFYMDAGIMAAIETINAVSRLPYKLSDFCDLSPVYYRSGEINFTVRNADRLLKEIEKKYGKSASKISRLDGITLEFGWGWFNLRLSNTEPLVRLNLESTDRELFHKELREIKRLIKQGGG